MSYVYHPEPKPRKGNLLLVLLAVVFGYGFAKSGTEIVKPWAVYRAQTDFNFGYKALQRGDELLAMSYFERGLEKDPENTHAAQQLNLLLTKYREIGASRVEVNNIEAIAPAAAPYSAPHVTGTTPLERASRWWEVRSIG